MRWQSWRKWWGWRLWRCVNCNVVALACDVNISLLLLTWEKADSFLQSCGALFLFVKWCCGWTCSCCQSDQHTPHPEHSLGLDGVQNKSTGWTSSASVCSDFTWPWAHVISKVQAMGTKTSSICPWKPGPSYLKARNFSIHRKVVCEQFSQDVVICQA